MNTTEAMILLKRYKQTLTKQQYLTIKGQIRSGNIEGAVKGLQKLTGKKVTS